jgi:hypothetical protein
MGHTFSVGLARHETVGASSSVHPSPSTLLHVCAYPNYLLVCGKGTSEVIRQSKWPLMSWTGGYAMLVTGLEGHRRDTNSMNTHLGNDSVGANAWRDPS